MSVSLKSLIGKLNNHCRTALEGAAGLCLMRTHYDVDLEHWLLKFAEMPDTDLQHLLRHYEINQVRLVRNLTRSLNRFKKGNARTPTLSPRIPRLISEAWTLASIDFGATSIRSGHILLALLENDDLVRIIRQTSEEFQKISVEDLHHNLLTLVAGSGEDKAEAQGATPEETRPRVPGDSGTPAVVRIFISYRREDSGGWAGRLYDRLRLHFGGDNVFMDIDTIEPGLDFVEVIQQAVGSCDVLIALIGRYWLTITDATGHRRLDSPEDFVRLEITTALERNIRTIPALLSGAPMPRSTDLPDVLKRLARRNALELSDARFHYDVDQLIQVLESTAGSAKIILPPPARPDPEPPSPTIRTPTPRMPKPQPKPKPIKHK